MLAGVCRNDMAVSDELVFVDEQSFDADGAAGVSFVRADADFGAKAITEPIGKPGRCVPENAGGIDGIQESPGVRFVFRHNRLGVPGTVSMNVSYGFVEA